MTDKIIHSSSGSWLLRDAIRRYVLKRFFPYFHTLGPYLRRGDMISVAPVVTGTHEPYMDRLIDHFVAEGYADFLIDIGANVGLTVYQNSHKFEKTIAFEPNGIVFNALKINAHLSNGKNIQIYNVGIGSEDGEFELSIPDSNFGGAFIKKGNSYPDTVLASKEGYSTLKEIDYTTLRIKVIGQDQAQEIVDQLLSKKERGFVKVDVEGYEPQVVSTIFRCLQGIDFVLVFENWNGWDSNALLQDLPDDLKFDLAVFSVAELNFFSVKMLESIRLVLGGKRKTMMRPRPHGEHIDKGEDVVLQVSWNHD